MSEYSPFLPSASSFADVAASAAHKAPSSCSSLTSAFALFSVSLSSPISSNDIIMSEASMPSSSRICENKSVA